MFDFLTDAEKQIVAEAATDMASFTAGSDAYQLRAIILKLAAKVQGVDVAIPPASDQISAEDKP
jgi:hypothetical protein